MGILRRCNNYCSCSLLLRSTILQQKAKLLSLLYSSTTIQVMSEVNTRFGFRMRADSIVLQKKLYVVRGIRIHPPHATQPAFHACISYIRVLLWYYIQTRQPTGITSNQPCLLLRRVHNSGSLNKICTPAFTI